MMPLNSLASSDGTLPLAPGREDGRIGPNAIIQLRRVLSLQSGEVEAAALLLRAGLPAYAQHDPVDMVPQTAVANLFDQVVSEFPPLEAAQVLRRAGNLTGDYIVANRIPAPARGLLSVLPGALAGPLLMQAISRHAWTFAGTGRTRSALRPYLSLTISANPVATPGCPWHLGVLETLFRTLATRRAQVQHVRCCGWGHVDCETIIRL